MAFWVYILRCSDGRYYTGHTDDLDRRIGEHQTGGFCEFTTRRLPVTLVWSENFSSRIEARETERKIKPWARAKKEALIRAGWGALSYYSRPPRERPSTLACPEHLPWQAVEGLGTNGGRDNPSPETGAEP